MKEKIAKKIKHIILIIWLVLCIFPLYWLLAFSLKNNNEIFNGNPLALPKVWQFENYKSAMSVGNVLVYFRNSIFVTALTIVIVIITSVMASYALSRLIFVGRKMLNILFVLGLTIPIHAALLPVFLILQKIGFLNSYASLIIPYSAFALSMAILICNSFMAGIPYELEDAACIDGCGTLGIFFRVIVPLMRPALSTIVIFTFLQAWNELMFATVFISDSQHRTLTVGIQTLAGTYSTNWGPIGAALAIATFPTIVVYLFMSNKVQQSLIAGAVKG